MTVAVVTTPPGNAQTYDSGATVDVPSGGAVVFQIADVLPDGSRGTVWPPDALRFEAIGSDLRVTAPDGTTLLFAGLTALLAGAAPDQVFAGPGPEQLADAPEAGPAPGDPGGPVSGGSSQAASPFGDDGLGNDFGDGQRDGGLEQPETQQGSLPTQDPNLPFLVLAQAQEEAAANDPEGRPPEEDFTPPEAGPGEENGEEPGEERPEDMGEETGEGAPAEALASLAAAAPADAGETMMAEALEAAVQEGTPGPDVFQVDAAEASETLEAATLIRGFEDGIDSIEISGAGPQDIVVADAAVLGGAAGDTALALAASADILAVVADVPAANIDGDDLIFA